MVISITIPQFIAMLFGLFMIFMTVRVYRKKSISWMEFLLWLGIWAGLVIAILLFKQVSVFAEKYLAIEPFDLFVLVAVFVIFAIAFSMNKAIKMLQKKIEEMTAELALKETNNGKPKKHPFS